MLFFVFSCQNDIESSTSQVAPNKAMLGKKLNNPYSLKVMKQAYKNIKEKYLNNASDVSRTAALFNDFNVETNFLYVKYAPQTEQEEATLKSDSTLILFDYPLDYEFTDEELANRPPLAENEIPQYYAAINITSDQAADEQYQLLEQLYIPEQDAYFDQISTTENNTPTTPEVIDTKQDLLRHLIYEAYTLTGNEAQLETPDNLDNGRWIFGSKWYPFGNIQVLDEVAGRSVPVTGAQVLMRQWFTVRQGITDGNGTFVTNWVRGKARYILQWERHQYSIRNGSFFQAENRGPNVKNQPWFYMAFMGDAKYHALIHQAACDYYYGHRFGLAPPPLNGHIYPFGYQRQMKIAARQTAPWNFPSSYSHLRHEITFGILAQVHVKAWGDRSDKVYGTTIHELTHAQHSVVDRFSYDNIVRDTYTNTNLAVRNRNKRLLETWPTTVEIMMTLDRYRNRFGMLSYEYKDQNPNTSYTGNLQLVPILAENHYTSGGYDLLDGFNQSKYNNESFTFPMDRVEGYSLNQLEFSLIGARSWYGWRDNIKRHFDNTTEVYVDELFNNWQD